MSRIIGIRHRVKRTAEGESRPTEICVLADEQVSVFKLETETDELDFVLGRFPVGFRPVSDKDDLAQWPVRHIKWRKVKKTEDHESFPKSLARFEDGFWWLATQAPASYDGLQAGDQIAMILGGSGDNLAYALSQRVESIGASIWRIPPFVLQANRRLAKEEDAQNLAELLGEQPALFYRVSPRDRTLILVRECLRARSDAMKARIACKHRLRARVIGETLRQAGLVEQGSIEDFFASVKANDRILEALADEESAREKDLIRALEALDVYRDVFASIVGVGPMIAVRLIAAIGDIRLFATSAKLKAFCGVHVLPDGRLPRLRHGSVANWHPDCRQALYLFADQCNRRPDSEWGQYLRKMKANLRQVHPAPEERNGKTIYSDAHIHKMALWRTMTRFVERVIFKGWRRVLAENSRQEAAA